MGKEIEKKDSLEYINVLRILALVLVILAHSSAVYTGYFQTFRMPLFVFISGYLYHFNRVKLNKYNSFPGFVRNKAKRLLIPYLTCFWQETSHLLQVGDELPGIDSYDFIRHTIISIK